MINRNPAPLIQRLEIKYSDVFRSRPVPSGDRATVYLDRHGQYHHMTWQLAVGDGGGMRALFLVDTSVVNRPLAFRTASQERAYQFIANVTASWRITDPVEAVRTNLLDAEFLVSRHIMGRLHAVTTRHPIEEVAAAESEAGAAFGSSVKRTLSQGLALLDCEVRLNLDEGAANEVRRRKEHHRAIDDRRRAHDFQQREVNLRAVEMAAQAKLNAQQAGYQRESECQQQSHEQERDHRRQLHEREMQRDSMEFYANALRADELNLVALRLAHNPGEVNEVIAMFMQQRKLDFESARGVLNALLDKGLVTRGNMAGIMAQSTAVIANQLAGSKFALDFGTAVPLPPGQPRTAPPAPPSPTTTPVSGPPATSARPGGLSVDQLFGEDALDEYDEDA
ncbi:hypothetical protein [Actinosynnema pretiosum]|uniref:Band 7 domain-containing protein n=1 Tax=Actinosynnema pretiosum TaxID=42197 RepID=A0A290Z0W9_9PSEU|nr:hypothetical protein [Actinosynnema pretiosum]ATE52681.1 hypothetical protein CNX65_04775 [Actinosynnema pretiosum]